MTVRKEAVQLHIAAHGGQLNLGHVTVDGHVAAHGLHLHLAGETIYMAVTAGRFEIEFPTGGAVGGEVAAGGLDGQAAHLDVILHGHVAVGGAHLDELPEPAREVQLHVGGENAPAEEEGGRSGVALADGQHIVIGPLDFQTVVVL